MTRSKRQAVPVPSGTSGMEISESSMRSLSEVGRLAALGRPIFGLWGAVSLLSIAGLFLEVHVHIMPASPIIFSRIAQRN